MRWLTSALAMVVGLALFYPVLAQEPAKGDTQAAKQEDLKKIQNELKLIRDLAEQLDARMQADKAKAGAEAKAGDKVGQVPPVVGKKGEPAKQGGRGYVPLTPEQRKHYQALSNARHGARIQRFVKFQDLPPSFDARVKVPLSIWDQANCGSCYLVATARTFTCAGIIAGYGKADSSFMLSAQYGMDRPRDFGGCNGGNGTEVADYMVNKGWIAERYVDLLGASHLDYPAYEARSGSDRTKPGAKVWCKGWTWGFVNANGSPTTAELKAAIYNFGRLNIALDAGGQFDGSGTITTLGNSIDHEINVVAYDDNHDNGNGTKGAFLLENQWGDWGTDGCQWCSYTAAKRIVDWFYVSATPLPVPVPIITAHITGGAVQAGVPFNLSPAATGGVQPYVWTFSYGDNTIGTSPTHTYAVAGKYTVTATVTDANNSSSTDAAIVTVGAAPNPITITVAVGDGVCQIGKPYEIRPVVTGAVGQVTWAFNYGDGTTGTTPSHIYGTGGTFTISATVIDSKGSIGTGTAKVTVSSDPVPPPIPGENAELTFKGWGERDGTYVIEKKVLRDANTAELEVMKAQIQRLLDSMNGRKTPPEQKAPEAKSPQESKAETHEPAMTPEAAARINAKMEAVLQALADYQPYQYPTLKGRK